MNLVSHERFKENGTIILIGATTENPYFSINKAILSRVTLFELHPLTINEVMLGIKRALVNTEKGLGLYAIEITEPTIEFLAIKSNGDLRTALNTIEICLFSHSDFGLKTVKITNQMILNTIKTLNIGDTCDLYNTISAFQKALRGSDVDASLHYLSRLLLAGQLEVACRRLIICSYEDVGLANPLIQLRVKSAVDTALKVGMPEARIPLSVAVIELALSPKSNSAYLAINKAMEDVENKKLESIPNHLKDSHYKDAKNLGVTGYKYPYDYEDNIVKQQYLPDNLVDESYFSSKHSSKYEDDLEIKYKEYKEKYFNTKELDI